MSIATSAPVPILVFAAFATLAVAGCGMNVTLNDDTTRRIEHDTVLSEGLTALDVTTDNGAIEVRGGGGDEIMIRTVLQETSEGDAEYSFEVEDDRLVVVGDCDGKWWQRCKVGFVVTVPSHMDVDVTTGSGRVEVADVAGDVRIDTDNGAIEGLRLDSPDVHAKTDNGRIELTFDESPLTVTTQSDNGAIAVRLPDTGLAYAVDADSDNGRVDIDVRTDSSAERRVTAKSDNGMIEVEYRST